MSNQDKFFANGGSYPAPSASLTSGKSPFVIPFCVFGVAILCIGLYFVRERENDKAAKAREQQLKDETFIREQQDYLQKLTGK